MSRSLPSALREPLGGFDDKSGAAALARCGAGSSVVIPGRLQCGAGRPARGTAPPCDCGAGQGNGPAGWGDGGCRSPGLGSNLGLGTLARMLYVPF